MKIKTIQYNDHTKNWRKQNLNNKQKPKKLKEQLKNK